jgi:ubiquinone/menaquinone biosynthesis C-methylase UbiE
MPGESNSQPPLPPSELMAGIGQHDPNQNLEIAYLLVGEALKSEVTGLLGPDWSWAGRRALDFGCGSGRLLRQFLDEAREAEFHGSDTSEAMVSWVREHLCPPIAGVRVNGERPPLDYPDGHFDLVTALSVFTHIADGWSDWLLEMHRILKPDGLLIATFLDSSCARFLGSTRLDEEAFGMSVFGFADPAYDWPNVLHSQWWLREHWGRAFEIVELEPGREDAYADGVVATHGWIALRPRRAELTAAELEREDPDDERYRESRRFQYELLRAEGEELKARHQRLVDSTSWRITSPLRRARALFGRRPGSS